MGYEKNFVEKVILFIYLIPLIIIGLATIIEYMPYGEAIDLELNLDRIELVAILNVYIITYILCFAFYKKTQHNIPSIRKFPKFVFNLKRIHIFVLLLLIIQIIFTKRTGNGVTYSDVNSYTSSIWTAIFNALNIVSFFPIYYVLAREKKKSLYWINIALFCVLRLSQGWSSFLLDLAMYEFFFFMKDNSKNLVLQLEKIPSVGLGAISIFLGGVVYKLIWPLKNGIRYESEAKIFNISLKEAILKLTSRLTNFPASITAIQNSHKMKELYLLQNSLYDELMMFFYPLVPSFFMEKDARPLGNIVWQTIYSTIENNTSTGMGAFTYIYILFKTNVLLGIQWIIIFFILFLITTSIIKAFNNKDNDGKILYFTFLLKCIISGELSVVYAYGFIGSIYLIIILILIGGIKLKRRA